jgi:hypothetical protein
MASYHSPGVNGWDVWSALATLLANLGAIFAASVDRVLADQRLPASGTLVTRLQAERADARVG